MIKYRADVLNYDIGEKKWIVMSILVVTDTLMREPPRSGLVQSPIKVNGRLVYLILAIPHIPE